MILREPDRFDGYLAMNMAHPWQSPKTVLPHIWRFDYQIPLATFGVFVQQRTKYVEKVILAIGSDMDPETKRLFADRFRDPVRAGGQRHLPHVPDP